MIRESTTFPGFAAARRREGGIALLVIMVVFVVLYLVIFQLHFSTKMEEHIAQMRYGETESSIALYSAGLFYMVHLIEDAQKQSDEAPGETEGNGADSAGQPRKLGEETTDVGGKLTNLPGASQGPGAGGAKVYDSLHENIFNDNQQQVGDTAVKISTTDGESKLDLNLLFDYVRIRGEEVDAAALSEDELVGAVTGANDDKQAEDNLRSKILQRIEDKRAKSKANSKATQRATERAEKKGIDKVAQDGEAGTGGLAEAVQSDYESPEFESPDPVRIEATRKMVERAILMMFSINENRYGYRYQRGRKYSASAMAQQIVDYVLARRNATFQNRIFLVTELLNLSTPEGDGDGDITPEIFYGPYPQLTGDDEIEVGEGFLLKRDEFGDIVPEYQGSEEDALYREEEKKQVAALEEQFGRFMDLGGQGLSRLMGNALTRGMQELPINTDQYGEDYVVEVPKPIGLKDLFTTYSTGKINLNTASVPILFGLLQSLTDDEAEQVAVNLADWRNRFRQEKDEEGISKVGTEKDSSSAKSSSGSRSRRDKSTEARSKSGALGGALAGGVSAAGLDPGALDPSLASSYEDLDLNYLTSLDQLDLIDGTDGGPQDVLRKDEGVQKVSNEDDTLYRRAIHDLEKVAVFSSTYFNAELKGKPKNGRSVKTGYLTVRRDLKKRMVDIVLWKNLQK